MNDLTRLTWEKDSITFGQTQDEYLDDPTWYKGAYVKVDVIIKTAHDLNNEIYYMNIHCMSKHHDLILDDTHILKNRPAFKSPEEESDYNEYLRTILAISLSEIRLLVDTIYVIGPSGLINAKGNVDKNEVEEFYWENRSRYHRTEYKQFLRMINDLMCMDIIMKKARVDSNNDAFNVPFFDNSKLMPSRFGFIPTIALIRKPKHGDLVFDYKKELIGTFRKSSSLYIADKRTKEIYGLDTTRRTFLFKVMLDFYLKHGKEKTLSNFKYSKILRMLKADEKTESGYWVETTLKTIA